MEDRHGTWVDEYFSTDSGGGYLTPRRVDVGLPKACDSSVQRALYAPNRLCSNLFPLPRARIPLPAKERRLGSPRRVYLCSLNLAKLPILIKIKTSSKTWPSTIRSLERTSIAMHPPLHSHPSQHDVPRDQKLLRALPGQRALTACERSRGCNRA